MTPNKEEAAEPAAWRWKWDGTVAWNLSPVRPHPKGKTDIEPLFAAPPQPAGEVERMREALFQALGALKALGAENGSAAEAVRSALNGGQDVY